MSKKLLAEGRKLFSKGQTSSSIDDVSPTHKVLQEAGTIPFISSLMGQSRSLDGDNVGFTDLLRNAEKSSKRQLAFTGENAFAERRIELFNDESGNIII